MPLSESYVPLRRAPGPLRLRRLTLGLSQAELAAAAGISREQIIRLEAGRCDPHWRTVTALAATLGADPTALFAANEKRGPGGHPDLAETAGMGDGRGTA